MKEKINRIIKDALKREERERRIGTYYASELPYCIRANYYKYKIPKEFDIETLMVFESGTIVHDWFAKIFRESELIGEHSSEGSTVYREGDFQIRGRFDNLFVMNTDNEKFLVEIKTVMDKRFIKNPKEHHVAQLNFYMNMLEYKKGYIIYVDRRNLGFEVFEIDVNISLFKEIIERTKILDTALRLGIMPVAEARNDKEKKWLCKYCIYKETCDEDEKSKEHVKKQV